MENGIWDEFRDVEDSGIGKQDGGSHAGVDEEKSGIGERDDGSHAGVDEEKSGMGVAPPDVEACSNDCCS